MQNDKKEWDFSPHIVETAYDYYKAAKTLYSIKNLGQVAVINAALSIEILFKSFNVSVSANAGKINEKYKFQYKKLENPRYGHDLFQLYELLPDEVKRKFNDKFTLDMIKKYRNTFTSDRYFYEKGANSGYSTTLISLAEKFINITVAIYKENGCDDIWIVNYPNV